MVVDVPLVGESDGEEYQGVGQQLSYHRNNYVSARKSHPYLGAVELQFGTYSVDREQGEQEHE